MHRRGALLQPVQPGISVQPLDRRLARVPDAAVNEERTVGHPADRFQYVTSLIRQ